MELISKPKKGYNRRKQKKHFWQLIKNKHGEVLKHEGVYNYSNVTVASGNSKFIFEVGGFGKRNISQTCFYNDSEETLRTREYVKLNQMRSLRKPRKVVVISDSDSDEDVLLKKILPKYELLHCQQIQTYNLSLVEALFLHNEIKCLDINIDGVLKDTDSIWNEFTANYEYFVQDYIIYNYLRCRNWIVKSGVTFGGDFIIYKDGPAVNHAAAVVVIDVLNEKLERSKYCRRSMFPTNISGLSRLCETITKELLICQIIWPTNCVINHPKDIHKVSVNEVLIRRWKNK